MGQCRFRLPVFLERVHTDRPVGRIHIGVVDLGQKEATRWRRGKLLTKHKLQHEKFALVRRSLRSFHFGL